LKDKPKMYDILNLDKLVSLLTKFIDVKLEIYELKVKNQLVGIISKFAVLGLIVFFGMFVLFFLSLALGAYLNSVLGNGFLGYIGVSLIYLVISLLMVFYKGKIINNRLFRAFFSDTLTYDDDEQDSEGQD
jgi:hypothetical protein